YALSVLSKQWVLDHQSMLNLHQLRYREGAITEDDNALRSNHSSLRNFGKIILKDVEPEEFKILMDNCPQI
ncbi:hypothetical protein Ocin01_13381, partial [Orchesella cincta]